MIGYSDTVSSLLLTGKLFSISDGHCNTVSYWYNVFFSWLKFFRRHINHKIILLPLKFETASVFVFADRDRAKVRAFFFGGRFSSWSSSFCFDVDAAFSDTLATAF